MKLKTLFLKASLSLLAVIVLFFNIFLFPNMIRGGFENYLFVFGMYASALLFYFVVYQAFAILRQIDKNAAFSEKTLTAVGRIKIATFAMGLSYIAFLPQIYRFADEDDAPGLVLIGMGIVLFPFIVSVFVAVLEKLLENAIQVKLENDLTV